MSGALLQVQDLKVHFTLRQQRLFRRVPVTVRALDGLNLALNAGEVLGIVGESGSGKSTLGRAILRLVEPTEGRILWDGQPMADLSPEGLRQRRRELQVIFQDPLAALDPRMTVHEIVAEPLRNFGVGREDRTARAIEALRAVGLSPEYRNRYPHEFSGGQCQRIAIARALVLRPRLIVCDEPVSALDVSIQGQIVNLLARLQRETGAALLFISHNLAVVRHISQRVAVLYLGKLAESAPTERLYREPKHPYTRALLAAIPVPDPVRERARPPLPLRGDPPSPLDPPSGCRFRTRCPHATDLCAAVEPELETIAPNHIVACHHWRDWD
ncbi:ABC transporter ATP-binding protein [Zavarzinia sp. CC-PAN008]|uniref:ABC transporter ATP-binding protein n=1 Tax=Zavarzinia sp. CC-PAN008 TaxID=3243332 RepID=UPI003F744049